jgi:alpha-L-fucosidase
VSKNGNLLLDVGPEADGTIPPVQLSRLEALGAWLKQNGEAIYGTRPWTRADGETSEGIPVRFTQAGSSLYVILMGEPKSASITVKKLFPKSGSQIYMLGDSSSINWVQRGGDVTLTLPARLPGHYAYVLRMSNPAP